VESYDDIISVNIKKTRERDTLFLIRFHHVLLIEQYEMLVKDVYDIYNGYSPLPNWKITEIL